MTLENFKQKIAESNVPDRWYALDQGLKPDAHILYKNYSVWEYFYLDERGGRNDFNIFYDEEDAFDCLWEKMEANLKVFRKSNGLLSNSFNKRKMKRILFYFLPILFLAACNKGTEKTKLEPRQAAVQKIDSLENQIKASIQKQENPDVSLAMHAIKNYQYFANDFPKDSLSPIYLFKAGQLYEGVLRDFPKAAEMYGKAYKDYPDFKNRPMMLFHEGNAYAEVQDTARAALKLNEFIRTYQDHPFNDDAQGLLRLMRMNDTQLEEFLNSKASEPQNLSAEKR